MKRKRFEFGKTYLTPREVMFVSGLVLGKTLLQISQCMGVKDHTVRKMRDTVYDKTGVNRQSLLVGLALSLGFRLDGSHTLPSADN